MKTIVVIPTHYSNARKVCNHIENKEFNSYTQLRGTLDFELGIDNESDKTQPQFFSLSDFREECNDQLFDFEGSFISYCEILK